MFVLTFLNHLDPFSIAPLERYMLAFFWQGGGVFVDETDCIGCLHCILIARQTFALTNEGRARAIAQDVDTKEVLDEAIDCCPVDCIQYCSAEDLRFLELQREWEVIWPPGLGCKNT